MTWIVSTEAELAADIARLDRMTADELAAETGWCEFASWHKHSPTGQITTLAKPRRRPAA